MMVLPFLLFSVAAYAGWRSAGAVSILFWIFGVVAMLVMFHYHVTSSLDLAF